MKKMDKHKLCIICGGKSSEHRISLISAKNVISALNKDKYQLTIIGIDLEGRWKLIDADNPFVYTESAATIGINPASREVYIRRMSDKVCIFNEDDGEVLDTVDIFFPVMHGAFGEDGTVQGLFRTWDLPFVGCDILGSALCMDKDLTKRVLRDSDIPVTNWISIRKHEDIPPFQRVVQELGVPVFVKPSNAGSSVGVSKVNAEEEYLQAIHEAFRHDEKLLIEEAFTGKEVECAILGNEEPKASTIGEIVPTVNFYDFDTKYLNVSAASLKIPAEIDDTVALELQHTALRAFQLLECRGLSRVDFFLKADNSFVLNEVNTLPGFTSTSMYPLLWEHAGLGYSDLLDNLIALAIDRYEKRKQK
jgi:D-alanine-D-alanine ligase